MSKLQTLLPAGIGEPLPYRRETAFVMLAAAALALSQYAAHCNWVTSEAYSSPSIVLIGGQGPQR